MKLTDTLPLPLPSSSRHVKTSANISYIIIALIQPFIAIYCINTLLELDIKYTTANYFLAATLIFIIKWK